MLLSAQTKVLSRKLDYEQAIEIIARAGFDAFDLTLGRIHVAASADSPYGNTADRAFLSDRYMDYAEQLRKTAEREHIVCNQAHAPFPPHRYGKEEYNARLFDLTVRSMEIASYLGAKTIVLHPVKDCPEEVDAFAYNVAFFNRFIPYCEKYKIKIGVENMFIEDEKRGHMLDSVCGRGEEHVRMCDALDARYFTACLDVGHSALAGDEAYRTIRKLGKERLTALHVHDNDYREDIHTFPYFGKADWDKILIALAEIGYDGDFTFETDNCIKRFPPALLPDALHFLCKIGRYLVARLSEFQKERA